VLVGHVIRRRVPRLGLQGRPPPHPRRRRHRRGSSDQGTISDIAVRARGSCSSWPARRARHLLTILLWLVGPAPADYWWHLATVRCSSTTRNRPDRHWPYLRHAGGISFQLARFSRCRQRRRLFAQSARPDPLTAITSASGMACRHRHQRPSVQAAPSSPRSAVLHARGSPPGWSGPAPAGRTYNLWAASWATSCYLNIPHPRSVGEVADVISVQTYGW
jgi:hypothetical protein